MAELVLNDLEIDEMLITKGGPVELLDVKIWKEFDKATNRSTDVQLGWTYECSLPKFKRRTFNVKVPVGSVAVSQEQIEDILEKTGDFPLVGFRKLTGSVYNKNGKQVITCKAEEIYVVPNKATVEV